MSALPRPDLPPGPHRDLVEGLHDLHHRAGWPSLRTLARDTGVSHTTVSKVISGPALPPWGTLELVVEALDGDTTTFHDLWLAASTPADRATGRMPRIAGRTRELAAVRRHLETGTGLLLVTGEAGIGKTTLVTAATETTEVFVAVGHCLPLSTEVPLLPLADALRACYASDDGQWLKEALADCPTYVRPSLSRLLPELGDAEGPATEKEKDPWGLERLFISVVSILGALASTKPLALHLEDCHWADRSTLDILTHITSRPPGFPVVATWRTGDPDVPEGHSLWLSRARWTTGVDALDLLPLTRDETAHQLRLLTGSEPAAGVVARIQARSQGLPLYTAQLAEGSTGTELPGHLAELLDRRLGDIGGAAWDVARVLGLAQRPVRRATLLEASGLEPAELDDALHALAHRRLLRRTPGDDAGLAHPLFVEAITRRLVPGESAIVHRRLAEALAAEPDIEPGVVAGHWQAAGQPHLEMAPRVAAARRAGERFAFRDELDAWSRVLELWDAGHRVDGLELWDMLARAVHASTLLADYDTGRPLVQRAVALDVPARARARLLLRAGEFLWHQGISTPTLDYFDEAISLLAQSPPSSDLGEVLHSRIGYLVQLGRYADAQTDVRRALAALDGADPRHQRQVLNWSAWLRMWAGDHEAALAETRRAQKIEPREPDPIGDLSITVNATDILLHAAAPATQVAEAARVSLHEVEDWHLENSFLAVLLRVNVAMAHLRSGDVQAARRAVEPVACADPSTTTASAHATLAAIELCEGHVHAAVERSHAAAAQVLCHDQNWTEGVPLDVDIDLWAGRLDDALSLLREALAIAMTGQASSTAAPLLTMTARAHADHLDTRNAPTAERHQVGARLQELVSAALLDPFVDGHDAAVPALSATWHAELARVEGRATVELWLTAAAAWDRLSRPHDTAYCRWRAAQLALRAGQGTRAVGLLKRAATDAREHVPLSQAIRATFP